MTNEEADHRPAGGGTALAEPALLDVRDLRVEFRTRDGVAKAVNGVSYRVAPGQTLAVLGSPAPASP